jgi:hypothetical protein
MARAVITSSLALAMMAATPGAFALGSAAPFDPPAVAASGVDLPLMGSPSSKGLSGLRLGRLPQALIDGSWFAQGATVRDDAVLVAIERQAVQLRHADGTIERLELSPDVAMTRSAQHPKRPSPTRMP